MMLLEERNGPEPINNGMNNFKNHTQHDHWAGLMNNYEFGSRNTQFRSMKSE